MRRLFAILLITLSLLMQAACSPQREQQQQNQNHLIINARNYPKYIERVRQGVSISRPLRAGTHLQDLLLFIQDSANKKKYYKQDEEAWLYDVAMIRLMQAEYLRSFRAFKRYIAHTGDAVRPLFHIGLALWDLHEHSGIDVLRLCLNRLVAQEDMSTLDYDKTIQLIKALDSRYVTLTQDREIDRTIRDSKEYKLSYTLYQNATRNFKEDPYDFIEFPALLELIPKSYIQEIASKPSLAEIERDFFIEYYTYVYTHDYEKAAFYADQKDWDNLGGIEPEYIMSRMMIAYLKTGRYGDVVELFRRNKKKVRTRRYSECYIPLWVGAAYAGLGDYEQAKAYLKDALEVTTLEDGYHVSYEEKGSILYVLFNLVFFLEEYEQFAELNRYGEIEVIVEEAMTRFQHLQQFNY